MVTLLTGREIADRIGARYEDVMQWSRDGTIPSIRITPRKILYNLEKVATALRDCRERELVFTDSK